MTRVPKFYLPAARIFQSTVCIINCVFATFRLVFLPRLQEKVQSAKKQAATPDEQDDLSPLPSHSQQPPSSRRRGAISAEPVTEEDATSYVKKVRKICALR